MNWQMFTAVAAIVGAIAVIAALLYVARQLKEATRQRRIELYHIILGEMEAGAKLLAQDQTSSDLWLRASKGLENLTDAERVRYFGMVGIVFRSWERAFHYHSEGELEDWRADAVAKSIADITMSRGVQEYWALRKRWFTREFQQWVDTKIKERGGVEVYGEQFRMFGSAEGKDHPEN